MTNTLFVTLSLASSLFVVACAADSAPSSDDSLYAADDAAEAGTSDSKADSAIRRITMNNKADRLIENGPDALRITARGAKVVAKITEDVLGNCTITKNTSASSATKTVFNFTASYEIDDGWNGCTIEFKSTSYKSTLTVGLNVTD